MTSGRLLSSTWPSYSFCGLIVLSFKKFYSRELNDIEDTSHALEVERPLARYMHSPFHEASIRLQVEVTQIVMEGTTGI